MNASPDTCWTLISRREGPDLRIFRVRFDRYRIAPTDIERDFVVLDGPDWVNVVPLTDDGEVVLVRQFRHGSGRVTLEVPGGVVNRGEDPAAAALRELREETGCAARSIEPIGALNPNPAIQTNRCHFFLARGVVPDGPPEPDEAERIEVVRVPRRDVPRLVGEGAFDHALVALAFGFAGLVDGPLSGTR